MAYAATPAKNPMEEKLNEVSEALGEESWDYIAKIVVEGERQFPGFRERARKLIEDWREFRSATPMANASVWADLVVVVCVAASICWIAWLIYAYNVAKIGVGK